MTGQFDEYIYEDFEDEECLECGDTPCSCEDEWDGTCPDCGKYATVCECPDECPICGKGEFDCKCEEWSEYDDEDDEFEGPEEEEEW